MIDPIKRKTLDIELGQLKQNLLSNELRAMQLAADTQRNTEAADSIKAAITTKEAEIVQADTPDLAESA